MVFLFRCAFFLGIVFYYLPWPEGSVSSLLSGAPAQHAGVKAALTSAAGEVGQVAAQMAARKTEEACRENSSRCAAYAAHLAQIVRQESQSAAASLAAYPLAPGLGGLRETSAKAPASGFEHWSLRLHD